MVAPISACLIVRNESAQLEACLKSIRPYVAEIIIVDTGSDDNSQEIARRYADKFEVYTGCNDEEGRILQFDDARNRSFSHATQPWVMWVDGDDEVVGAENLESQVQVYDRMRAGGPAYVMFPYEYARDARGNVTCVHYRERLICPKGSFKWVNWVHEVLIGTQDGIACFKSDQIKWVHKRDFSRKKIEHGRNLRILKRMYEKFGDSDARHLYYLGLEYGNNGDMENALKFLKRYIELSGWDDEKYLACIKICEHYQNVGDYENQMVWAWKAISIHDEWPDAYFSLARGFYFLAHTRKVNPRHNFEQSIKYTRKGFSLPTPDTLLFVNPIERSFDIHTYYNLALNYTGDVPGALASVEEGLKVRPDDRDFLLNERLYRDFLARQKFNEGLDTLVNIGSVSPRAKNAIISLIEPNASIEVVDNSPPPPVSLPPPPQSPPQLPPAPVIMTDLDSDAKNLSIEEMLAHITPLWKHLLLHDELLNARALLQSAPWQIREHLDILRMKSMVDSMLAHVDDPNVYRAMYKSYYADIEKESVPLPEPIMPKDGQHTRYSFLLSALEDLKKKKSEPVTVLDIGSIDGWTTNRLGLLGYKAFGIDYNESAVHLANKKAAEFNTGSKHACVLPEDGKLPNDFPETFDVVVLFEVYEHVVDTVGLLKNAAKYLNPGGTLVMSTPRGSWCQGMDFPFHGKWNEIKPREHIRAPIISEVVRDLMLAGFSVSEYKESLIDQSEQPIPIHTQASICVRAEKKSNVTYLEPIPSRLYINPRGIALDIVFYVGNGVEPWNPRTAKEKGIGGSETAVIEMSKRLAKLGHKIRVFGDCRAIEGVFDGVAYIDSTKYGNLSCDVLITSRRPEAVDDSHNVKRKATLCWVHDTHLGGLTHERSLKIDKFLVLSDWHKNNVQGIHQFIHDSQIIKTRNGIDLDRFNRTVTRDPHRAVYSSSPDRGMQVAICVWPLVRQRIPDATLHIFYGFKIWEACANDDQKRLIEMLRKMIHDYETAGVVFHDRVPQDRLAEEYMKSGVWAYPTWFSETSCELAGSLIFTREGMKPIEDIKIGDLVLTHKGRFRSVTKLIRKNYDGPLYTMKRAKDNRPISLTGDHPLYVAQFHKNDSSKGNRVYSRKNDRLSWKVPGDLVPNRDYLTSPKMTPGSRTSVLLSDYIDMPVVNGYISRNHDNPIYRPVLNEQKLTCDFMYILGLFAAEGCVSRSIKRQGKNPWSSAVVFAFHQKETHLVQKVIDFFGRGSIRPNSENGISVIMHSSPWANFLKKVIGTGNNKKIPDFVWDSSLELQASFLRGMTDGDGCKSVRPGRTGNGYAYSHYTSVSPSLAYGAAQILANIETYASVNYDSFRNVFNLIWADDPKSKQYKVVDDVYCTRLNSVSSEHYSGMVYNFEVEEDRSYVTDRTIVHNCISAMEAQAAGLRMVTSPIAALNETVGPRGTMIDGDWLSWPYQQKFVDGVVEAMQKTDDSDRIELQKYAAQNFSWQTLAEEWSVMLPKVIAEVEYNIVPMYKGYM